jgi:hypothetical protein
MNCLRPLKYWDRGFEFHARRGWVGVWVWVRVRACVRACARVCVLSCMWGLIPVKGVLLIVYRIKKLKKKRAAKAQQWIVQPLIIITFFSGEALSL